MSEISPLCAMNCHHRFFELEDFFKSSKENGYRYVELWTGPQHFFMDHREHESIQKLLDLEEKYGLKIIGICPEQTNPKPNNMAAKAEAMQERVFNYFKRAIDVAVQVKANQVVVTSGWAFYSEDVKAARSRSIAMLKQISSYAKERGMILAIEALQKDESLLANRVIDLKEIVSEVGTSALKICLDLGAMEAAGETIQDYFDAFGKEVVHVHFVDVKDQVTHLAWGDGDRKMQDDLAGFAKNHYRGLFSVECVNGRYFTDPQKADRQSMEQYRRLIEW